MSDNVKVFGCLRRGLERALSFAASENHQGTKPRVDYGRVLGQLRLWGFENRALSDVVTAPVLVRRTNDCERRWLSVGRRLSGDIGTIERVILPESMAAV